MIIASQAAAGTAVSTLLSVPAGPGQLILSNVGTVTAWVGPGTVTSSNGFPVATSGYPVAISLYPASPAAKWTCVTSTGSTNVAYILSTASGGTKS